MKKSFLILMLMALLPMAGFALTLDVSKFKCPNIDFGSTALPAVEDVGTDHYTVNTDYEVEEGYFYTSNTGAGKTAIGTAGATLATTAKGKYYRKVIGLADYDGQAVYVDFWINGVDVDLTITGGISKTFGQNDPDLVYTLVKHGTTTAITDAGLTITREAGNDVKTGGYAFSFTWTNESYDITRTDANVFTINPKAIGSTSEAPATITEWQGNVVYTGNDIFGVYTVKDGTTTLEADKDYTVSAAHNVGAYAPTITFKGNYSGTINVADAKKFNVTKAPIVVGVEDLEVTYDGTNHHDMTATGKTKLTYSGFVGADAANATALKAKFGTGTATVETKEAEAITPKDYELVIAGVTSTDDDLKNYEIKTYMPGKLTIKQANLTIKAKDAEKGIGEADPAFVLDPTLLGGLTVTGVTFTREEGETAGEFKITPNVDAIVIKDGDDVVTANYKPVVDATGKLTIGKTTIYVAIKDAKKLYGEADPEFTYSVTGLKGTDALAAFEITRDAGEKPGSYAVTATVANPNTDKYKEVVVANGILTIEKAQLEFTIPAQTIAKNDPETKLKKELITVDGINNSDVAADLYNLGFNTGVDNTIDNTDDDGIKVSLKTTTVKVDGADVAINTLYTIVLTYDADHKPATFGTETYGKLIVGNGNTTAIANLDYATIQARAGEKVTSVTVKITPTRITREVPTGTAHPWAAETWNTMVLPFEVTVAELSAQLGYAIVNVVDAAATTEDNVQFKLEMQKVPANTPFCVKTSEAIPTAGKDLTFANKLIVDGGKYPEVAASSEAIGYKFVGAYDDKTINKTTPNLYFLRGNTPKWAHIKADSNNEWTVVPFDAYIDQAGAAGARELTFTFQELDGTMTAIKSVEASVNEKSSVKEGWYTIGGVKLNAAPTQKGIYINNGKKVVIK